MKESDFLIIGSGVAGLSLALDLAQHGSVNVVTKTEPSDSNTNLAQGGIAGVLDSSDSFALHVEDTIRSGMGLCRRDVVEAVVSEGPDRIRELMNRGHTIQFALGPYGGYQAIMKHPEYGVYIGASESRKDGQAAGY